jgi:hypothetical protein
MIDKNLTGENHRYLEIRAILKEIYVTSRRITHKELKLEELKLIDKLSGRPTDEHILLKMDVSMSKDKMLLDHLTRKLQVLQSSTVVEGYMTPTQVLEVLDKDKTTYLKN